MDPWIELAKVWGPLSIGWLVAAYLIKFIMDRYDRDIESRTKLASSLDAFSKILERVADGKN